MQQLSRRIEAWLLDWLGQRTGVPVEEVRGDKPFTQFGLDSMSTVELSHDLEKILPGILLHPTMTWNHPTPAELACHLARLSIRELERVNS